jgi:hypothetical protein
MGDVVGYSDARLAAILERPRLKIVRLAERFGETAALEIWSAWQERKVAANAELSRRATGALNAHAEATGTPIRFYPSRPQRPQHSGMPMRKATAAVACIHCGRSRGTTRASRATRRQRVVRSHGTPGREDPPEEPDLDPPAFELYAHSARCEDTRVAGWLEHWGDERAGLLEGRA